MLLLILGIIGWFVCGWLAGWWMRQTYMAIHLGWTKQDEISMRLYIMLGGVTLLGVGVMWCIFNKKCHYSNKEMCQEYIQTSKRKYSSWFGKSSDYDKIPHPELSVNL